MDRKDYIVAQTDCRDLARQFISFATEAFLVTLANKGLYKRALKDLEAAERVELSGVEGSLRVLLDDVTVQLQPNVSQSTCTCPSKTVCKHILMAILATSEYATSAVEAAVESVPEVLPTNAWDDLKRLDIAALRKQAGKKLFEETLRLIQDGWTADFVEGDMLEARINTENITVYFPRQNSLSHAVCKCGDNGLCRHKLIAILSYLSRQGSLSHSPEEAATVSLITEDTKGLLEAADSFIIHLLDKGLISCGENEVDTAIQYSIRMETCGIGNLSRLFRSLSSDLENMLGKHVGFSQITTFATLSRLHNTMRLILLNTQDNALLSQLIESTRSDYYTTPIGHFSGLGACPWQTRSGYLGTTAYFFYHEKQTICTYTLSIAGYYEQTENLATMGNLKRLYQKGDNWADGLSLAILSHSVFTLRNFKLNKQNRLSSSNQTQCELTGNVDLDLLHSHPDFSPLFDISEPVKSTYTYFQKKQVEQLALVPFTRLVDMSFSHTEQKLFFTMEQADTSRMDATLEFNELNKDAIHRLEQMSRYPDDKARCMVCLRRPDTCIPVCMVGLTEIENFFFT